MKTKLFFVLLLFIGISTVTYSQDTVSTKDSKNFIGETKIVRGIVASIFVSNKGTVLINFDEAHPNATFVAVIKTGSTGVSYADVKKGSIMTITGKIEEYKGKPEIIITEQSQIISVENQVTKEQEILSFLNKNIFNPILNSSTASPKLKIGVRQTKMKLRHKDALGMISFYWSSIVGTSRSRPFAAQMKKEGFVRFEEVMDEFRSKFSEEWLRKKLP